MAFLRRDFIHPDASSWRKRVRAMTLFSDASGKLVAAYSYNTALASVEPDAEQVSGIRIYLNISKYSKGSNEHMGEFLARLNRDYGCEAIALAAEADNVPVGSSATQLRELCGARPAPHFVRERAVPGRQHLTMRDLRRTFHAPQMHAHDDGSEVAFIFTSASGCEYQVDVIDGAVDYDADDGDGDGYTLSPDAYAYVLATQGKLAALAEARGAIYRNNGYRRYVDMTYSRRGAFTA